MGRSYDTWEQVAAATKKLEAALDLLARDPEVIPPPSDLLAKPFEHLSDTASRRCAACKVEYCPYPYKGRPGYEGEILFKTRHGEQAVHYYRGLYLFFGCCSEGCARVVERRLKHERKWRDREWQTIKEGKGRLREARQWLRLHGV